MTRIIKIERIVTETTDIKTFFFRDNVSVNPGQFMMVWVPGIDEFPMSYSYVGELKAITVRKLGDGTAALHRMKVGEMLGIRGPYGNGFRLTRRKTILAVIGGCGAAVLAPAIENAVNLRNKVFVALGARTKKELLFVKRLKKVAEVQISTDDGSVGHSGPVTELAAEMLFKNKIDLILTCGPEPMLFKVCKLGDKYGIPVQAAIERYMKCALGLCDSCALDGYHVCKDGPVFDGSLLLRTRDFGRFIRDASGTRVSLGEV